MPSYDVLTPGNGFVTLGSRSATAGNHQVAVGNGLVTVGGVGKLTSQCTRIGKRRFLGIS